MNKAQMATRFIPNEYDIFAGLDVDKKSIAATFLEHDGNMKQIKMPYNGEHLMNYVNKRYPDKRVAFVYEAGPTGFGLYDELSSHHQYCMVTSASNIPREPSNRVKTNRLDSKKLSENLRGGQLRPVHVPTQEYRELRHLIQMRDTFVQQAKSTKYRIKSLLLVNGLKFPETETWTIAVMEQLKELPCTTAIRFHLNKLILSLEFFNSNVIDTTKAIRSFCKHDDDIKKNIGFLMSIPGIGFITASQLMARIGDWRNLYRYDQIGSFLGLVPSEKSTGDDIKRGSITRMGNTNLRSKLIQCAWSAIRKDQELQKFYLSLFHRNLNDHGAQKAITAVARKLTTRIYAVLTQQRNYEVRIQQKKEQKEKIAPFGE
ncbi:MAG: IS110 family transposase [Endomicrobiales bacterium]